MLFFPKKASTFPAWGSHHCRSSKCKGFSSYSLEYIFIVYFHLMYTLVQRHVFSPKKIIASEDTQARVHTRARTHTRKHTLSGFFKYMRCFLFLVLHLHFFLTTLKSFCPDFNHYFFLL